MDLNEAYREIWRPKLVGQQDPRSQSIPRVNQTASLWRKHFGDVGRLTGPLLDVGCGSGAMLGQAEAAGITAIGVDFSADALGWLEEEGYDTVQRDLNTDALPEVDGGFQIATCCDVIEHLIDPDHVLSEMHRVLAPGGHAYVSTPNCSHWKRVEQLAGGEMFRTSGDNVLRDGGHLSYWGPHDLKAALERAGLRGVAIHYEEHNPAPSVAFATVARRRGEWSDYWYMIAYGVK